MWEIFEDSIWKCCRMLARNMSIDVAMPCARKWQSRLPSKLESSVIMGAENDSPLRFYRQRYFEILDRVLRVLKLRFDDHRDVILSVAACNPKNEHFLSLDRVQPLAEASGIDLPKLAP